MGARLLPSVLGITLLTGCARQNVQSELPVNHPANPAAAIAAIPARSTALLAEPVDVETDSAAAAGGHDHATMTLDLSGSAHNHGAHGVAGDMADGVETAEADGGGDPAARAASSEGADKVPASSGGGQAAALYVCPMHHEVTSATPARCPKCKMKLTAGKPGGVGAASRRRSAGEAANPAGPTSARDGETAASESAAGDDAQGTPEGHDTQESPAQGGGHDAHERHGTREAPHAHDGHDAHDAHAGHDPDGGNK
jgi:hypothetical protein